MSEHNTEKVNDVLYNKIKKRISIAEIVINIALLLFFAFSSVTVRISDLAEFYLQNQYLQFFLFVGIIGVVFYIVGLAFSFYGGYIIEKDFGLSNQNLAQWALEQAKTLLVTLVIGIPVACAFYTALLYGGELWWFYFATVIVLLSVILARLAPIILFPLFYTFTPLDDESVRERIQHHLEDTNITIENIFSFNLSKTTKKANAAFTGMGKTKRIILSDTLVDNFTPEEIGAVFAHEVGHFRRKHIVLLMVLSTVVNYLSYFVCAQLFALYLHHTGYMNTATLAALPMLLLLLSLFSLATMPVINYISRKFEWEADTYALEHEDTQTYVSALEKLSELNVADKDPHPIYEFIFYSHPAITKRIAYAQSYTKQDTSV